jgi:hypothetical protein
VPGLIYGISAKQVGQTCTFADTEGSNAFAVMVIGGPAAARAYRNETHGLGRSLAPVPVVSGGKAVRQRADSRGSVSTAEVASIKGSTSCAVIPTDDEMPGVARLQKAAGYTAAIGDKAYADIAAAIGTVCNRIYHSGSTNPASALAALRTIHAQARRWHHHGADVPAGPQRWLEASRSSRPLAAVVLRLGSDPPGGLEHGFGDIAPQCGDIFGE